LYLLFSGWIRDPRSGIRDPRSGIRDGEKSGSGINIPDPQHWCFLSLIESLHILTSGEGKNMKKVGTKDIFSLLTIFLFAHLNCLLEGGKNCILSPLVQSFNILILVEGVNIRPEINQFDIFSPLIMFLFAPPNILLDCGKTYILSLYSESIHILT